MPIKNVDRLVILILRPAAKELPLKNTGDPDIPFLVVASIRKTSVYGSLAIVALFQRGYKLLRQKSKGKPTTNNSRLGNKFNDANKTTFQLIQAPIISKEDEQ